MSEAYTHHALTPMKQAFDDSRWLRQTRDKRSIGIRKPLLYPTELWEPAEKYVSNHKTASQSKLLTGSSGLELPRVLQVGTQAGVGVGIEPSPICGDSHRLWRPSL